MIAATVVVVFDDDDKDDDDDDDDDDDKFIDMKYRLCHIRTDHNVADIFTKALFIQKFKDVRNKLFNII